MQRLSDVRLLRPAGSEPGGGRPALAFKIAHCTSCGLCRNLCHWKVVNLSSGFDLGELWDDSPAVLPMPAKKSSGAPIPG